MKKNYGITIYTVFLIFCFFKTYSQSVDKITEVNTFITKWNELKSISYDTEIIEKAIFSEDTTEYKEQVYLIFNSENVLIASKECIDTEEWNRTNYYNGEKTYFLNNDQMTYSIGKRNNPQHKFFGRAGIIDSISYSLLNNPTKIQLLSDTLIDGVQRSYFKFIKYEKKKSLETFFTHSFIAFDKKDLSPVFFMEIGKGEASVEGKSLGVINVFSKTKFLNVQKDRLKYDIANFSPPVTASLEIDEDNELLKKGDANPSWQMTSLDGTHFNSNSFVGKNTLLFLTVTDCPANQLSIKTINSIVDRFGKKIKVIGIYDEKEERLKKYINKNPLKFPVIANGKDLKLQYNATGSPYYYLIDRNGMVFYSELGYTDQLEEKLTKNIDSMLSSK